VVEFLVMKKAMRFLLISLAAAVVILLAVLPVALPQVVTRIAEARLAEFGFPSRVRMNLGYVWNGGPELAGTLLLGLVDSPVEARATFGVGLGTWHVRLKVPTAELTDSDPTVRRLLTDNPLPKGISNLTFSATVSLEASAERTHRTPVPVWSAKAPVRIASASVVTDNRPVSVTGLSFTPGASGIADHLDIAPMFLRTAAVSADGFTLTNVTASVRATGKSLLVTEATASLCGGTISLYSLFLDTKTRNTGFTLFLEDVDAGEILCHLKGFRGEASGQLHGKIRLFVREGGKAIRFSDAFLYSTPGETGKLKMEDAAAVTDNLALAGIDEASRQNVANALSDLDYSVLRLNLKRTSRNAATLGVRLEGTATRGSLSVPVNLNINFNGDIEQIVNTGLGFSEHLKGKKK